VPPFTRNNGTKHQRSRERVRPTPEGDAVFAEVFVWALDAAGRRWSKQDFSHFPFLWWGHGYTVSKGSELASE